MVSCGTSFLRAFFVSGLYLLAFGGLDHGCPLVAYGRDGRGT